MFGGNFAPRGWAFCDGQLLPIAQNTALFSILGTTYGGDGTTTFGLPDLRGRAVLHHGHGPGLTPRVLGQKFGEENNVLTINQLPQHKHHIPVSSEDPDGDDPDGQVMAVQQEDSYAESSDGSVYGRHTSNAGGGQPLNNMQPFIACNYIIALVGIFPS